MGGGGRFVPLIGDTHPLSLMPSRNMVKYATNTQNSSKSTVASAATCKRLFDWLMSRCARTISIRFTFSSKDCEYPSRVSACLHCSTVIRSDGWDLTSATWSNTRRTALKWNRTMNIFAAYRELSQKMLTIASMQYSAAPWNNCHPIEWLWSVVSQWECRPAPVILADSPTRVTFAGCFSDLCTLYKIINEHLAFSANWLNPEDCKQVAMATYCDEIVSLQMLWSGLYGCNTKTKCFAFCPEI